MTQNSQAKKSKSKFKGILNLSFLTPKKKHKCSPEPVSKNEGQYEFDAVPDEPRENFKRCESVFSDQDESEHESSQRRSAKCSQSESDEEPQKGTKEEAHCNNNKNNKEREQFTSKSVINFTINGGTGYHIGNTNIYNFGMNGMNGLNAKRDKKTCKNKMPTAVKDLMNCSNELERAHLDFLSGHFGVQWEKIAVYLQFTNGEIDEIKDQFRNLKERGYQMMLRWWQQNGTQTTVGQLCQLLWKSGNKNAHQAVQQLPAFLQQYH